MEKGNEEERKCGKKVSRGERGNWEGGAEVRKGHEESKGSKNEGDKRRKG